MFIKNKMIQIKFVNDVQTPAEPTLDNALVDFAAADIARERCDRFAKKVAAGFVLYKTVDTLNKIALHTALTKIK